MFKLNTRGYEKEINVFLPVVFKGYLNIEC